MTTFTNVPDTNLEPGDPIRSVDIIAIKDNTLYLHDKLGAIDVQTFNSNGTWTKPTVNGTIVGRVARIQVWGGGGGGAAYNTNNNSSGGGGGGYNEVWKNIEDLGSTETVTVGVGGTGVLNGNGFAQAGGPSSFGSHCSAYGGAGATFLGSGGGGGQLSAGVYVGSYQQGTGGSPNVSRFWEGGAGAYTEDSQLKNIPAQNSVYGGAGGGSNSLSYTQPGGVSVYGGNGGNVGNNGIAPGGGGGGGFNGANGRVVITVF